MKFEKSAGAVVFREVFIRLTPKRRVDPEKGITPIEREYLLLSHTSLGKEKRIIWDFPKGQVKEGEAEKAAAEREVGEETGLSEFSFIDGFRETIRILYKWEGEFHSKTVVFFLAQATSNDVKISFEHVGFEWLSYEDALVRLSFKNSKEILKKAEDFLNGKNLSPQLNLGFRTFWPVDKFTCV